MVSSLWTAATGMKAQQSNVDTIANNLANVNTVGHKTEVAEFKSLLYQYSQSETTSANGENKPVSAQIGLGVRNSSITSIFKQGMPVEASSGSAFMIEGNGFFAVQGEDGNNFYTRNGSFTMAIGTEGLTLSTSDGMPVLDSTGKPIVFSDDLDANQIETDSEGEFYYPDEEGIMQSLDMTIGVYQFTNPGGLEKNGGSLFSATAASGLVMNEATNDNLKKSAVIQGYLEGSNVQVVDEMVNMIVAQRAYEMSSKAIQASDEMMQQANQLKG